MTPTFDYEDRFKVKDYEEREVVGVEMFACVSYGPDMPIGLAVR